jgi:hypothetical protein
MEPILKGNLPSFFHVLLRLPFISLPSPSHTAGAPNLRSPLRFGPVSWNHQQIMGLERRVIWKHDMAVGMGVVIESYSN